MCVICSEDVSYGHVCEMCNKTICTRFDRPCCMRVYRDADGKELDVPRLFCSRCYSKIGEMYFSLVVIFPQPVQQVLQRKLPFLY